MKTVLIRTGSGSVMDRSSIIPGSPRISVTGVKKSDSSPRLSVHFELNRRGIRRTSSDSDMIRSEIKAVAGAKESFKRWSTSFPARIPEEECDGYDGENSGPFVLPRFGSLSFSDDDRKSFEIPTEDVGFPGGGIGNNRTFTGGGRDENGADNADRSKIGAYYQEMIKSNPTNSLLLTNYAKYLHQEGDNVKAEEYYGRAILASPGDGEILSMYGKLIWETERDENRAKSYFDQAVHASPDDCAVLGSYAHFMWEAEEDGGEEFGAAAPPPAAVVGAL